MDDRHKHSSYQNSSPRGLHILRHDWKLQKTENGAFFFALTKGRQQIIELVESTDGLSPTASLYLKSVIHESRLLVLEKEAGS